MNSSRLFKGEYGGDRRLIQKKSLKKVWHGILRDFKLPSSNPYCLLVSDTYVFDTYLDSAGL